jgi:AcrR family transcriptional regulator
MEYILSNQFTEFNPTQQKILDAAIACVKQWGIEKTSLNDIAKAAGVTRPTVYSYFPNRNDVIRCALLQSGYVFAEKLMAYMSDFERLDERFIETVLYAIEELPKEPYLAVIIQGNLSSLVNEDALSDEEGQKICIGLFNQMFADVAVDTAEMLEVMEFTVRMVLSILMLKGPVERNIEQWRATLKRRLLPMIGILQKNNVKT